MKIIVMHPFKAQIELLKFPTASMYLFVDDRNPVRTLHVPINRMPTEQLTRCIIAKNQNFCSFIFLVKKGTLLSRTADYPSSVPGKQQISTKTNGFNVC